MWDGLEIVLAFFDAPLTIYLDWKVKCEENEESLILLPRAVPSALSVRIKNEADKQYASFMVVNSGLGPAEVRDLKWSRDSQYRPLALLN